MKSRLLRKRVLVGTLVFVLLIIFVSEWQRVAAESVTSWTNDPSVDCAVVLTGGPGRIKEGFALLSRKSVKKLIISGVNPDSELRDIFPQWPVYGKIEESDVIIDRRSSTTYGNAQQSLAIAEALNCRDVAVVTSRLHMRRAYQTFRSAFPQNIALIKHAIIIGRTESDLWEVSTEVIKSIFYSLWAY